MAQGSRPSGSPPPLRRVPSARPARRRDRLCRKPRIEFKLTSS
jgi:hypothetical protein